MKPKKEYRILVVTLDGIDGVAGFNAKLNALAADGWRVQHGNPSWLLLEREKTQEAVNVQE